MGSNELVGKLWIPCNNSLTSQNVLAGQECLGEVLGFLVGWLAHSLVCWLVPECNIY